MNTLNKTIIAVLVISGIVALISIVDYANGQEIITPYNTGNDNNMVQSPLPIYCGFGQTEDCINNIPQGVKIPKSQIWHIGVN